MATLNNSLEPNSNQSMSSVEDFRAKTCPWPESALELKDLALACGLSTPVFLGFLDHDLCSLKMSQVSLFTTQCDEWSESWPDSGMWGSGEVFELRTSALPICESASSSWPTPVANDAEKRGNFDTERSPGEIWSTPSAHDGRRPGSDATSTQGANLKRDAEKWQTPATDSFRSRGGDRKDEMWLDQQARTFFPTPASRDYRTPNKKPFSERGGGSKGEQLQSFVEHCLDSHQDRTTNDGSESSSSGPTLPRRLNPRFVEWLMGFPIGWTEP
jgi:hypothetical protein